LKSGSLPSLIRDAAAASTKRSAAETSGRPVPAPNSQETPIQKSGFPAAAGAPFAERHELSANLMASVPPTQIGRLMSGARRVVTA
jgi:hypothetical protein